VSAFMAFETLTGLSIYFLPFSIPNQVMVLLHTAGGLIITIPFTIYMVRHMMVYNWKKFNHFKLTGYVALVLGLALTISGLVLSYQAAFLPKIGQTWDMIHTLGTFAFVVFLLPHTVLPMIRNYRARSSGVMASVVKAQNRYLSNVTIFSVVLFALIFLAGYSYESVELNNEFPEDYALAYGEDRPFAPSLATTNTGGAFDAKSMSGSESCGTAGCHEEIYKEWQVSAHRYSAMDVGFQKVQSVMAQQNGPESTRYCGGCHDPISLFSGTKNIFVKDLTNLTGYQEGVSCISCHAIKKTDIKGNANYVMTQPDRYMFEMKDGKEAKFLSDFLIRAYPQKHIESLQHTLFKSPEFCAACHKQFIDEEINKVGWVQLQNQFDNWRKSRWNHPGDPTKTVECRECHMPLVDSMDPANGDTEDYNRTADDNKHRSHRFLAANQYMPKALDLPGADEHIELTKKWLRGELEIPEIATKWKEGPAVPIELVVPEQVTVGDEVDMQAMITNNKVGHEFPTGPLDIIQAWVEVVVTDQDGNEIFSSGVRDEEHFIKPGAFMFKAEPVDQYGNLIDKHNLWEMVGVRYRRSMFPGFSDKAEYAFSCPAVLKQGDGKENPIPQTKFAFSADKVGELHVTARLMYRKFDQYLLNFLFGADSGLTAPVTVMSEDEKTIIVNSKQP
ncbi:MAG: multiheme c-type cytochrome, partial [Saprospiraceae bacterium]